MVMIVILFIALIVNIPTRLNATVITFDEPGINVSGYTEDGYTITWIWNVGLNDGHSHLVSSGGNPGFWEAGHGQDFQGLKITRSDLAPISLDSMDMGGGWVVGPTHTTGTLFGPGIPQWTTISPGLPASSEIYIYASSVFGTGAGALDNLVLSTASISEPATILLLGLGLTALLFLRRRKTPITLINLKPSTVLGVLTIRLYLIMKKFEMVRIAITLALFFGLWGQGQAVIIQVPSPVGLAPGPFTLEDFEDSAFQPGVVYSSLSGVQLAHSSSYAGGVTPSGVLGLSTKNFPDSITLTFTSPASSVGLFFGNDDTCCSGGFTAFLDIFDIGGLIGTISLVANMNDFADQFIGFNSDQAVTQVRLRYGSGSNVSLFPYIDDARFNTTNTAVPEPISLFLLGSGLAGLRLLRLRSKAA